MWQSIESFKFESTYLSISLYQSTTGKRCRWRQTWSHSSHSLSFSLISVSPILLEVCVRMLSYAFVCVRISFYAFVCIRMRWNVFICVCMSSYAFICVNMHAYALYAFVCVRMGSYAFVCVRMRTFSLSTSPSPSFSHMNFNAFVCARMHSYAFVCLRMSSWAFVCARMRSYAHSLYGRPPLWLRACFGKAGIVLRPKNVRHPDETQGGYSSKGAYAARKTHPPCLLKRIQGNNSAPVRGKHQPHM